MLDISGIRLPPSRTSLARLVRSDFALRLVRHVGDGQARWGWVVEADLLGVRGAPIDVVIDGPARSVRTTASGFGATVRLDAQPLFAEPRRGAGSFVLRWRSLDFAYGAFVLEENGGRWSVRPPTLPPAAIRVAGTAGAGVEVRGAIVWLRGHVPQREAVFAVVTKRVRQERELRVAQRRVFGSRRAGFTRFDLAPVEESPQAAPDGQYAVRVRGANGEREVMTYTIDHGQVWADGQAELDIGGGLVVHGSPVAIWGETIVDHVSPIEFTGRSSDASREGSFGALSYFLPERAEVDTRGHDLRLLAVRLDRRDAASEGERRQITDDVRSARERWGDEAELELADGRRTLLHLDAELSG
jgi:hypothetical protein